MSKQSKSLADKQAELDEVLAWFDSDDFSIEQAMERFEQAKQLAGDIENELTEYKNTFTTLKQRFDEAGE